MKTTTYLHGYDTHEQVRLIKQAQLLENYVFRGVDFSKCKKIIEVGSGVGAQTEILLKRFPHLQIDCVDLSEKQIEFAKQRLNPFIKSKQVKIIKANAAHLPMKAQSYDGAFICWFLEHVIDPTMILEEVKRVLKFGGSVYCSEVFNQSFFISPSSKIITKYFEEYNDLQKKIKGDPDIGPKVATFLRDVGFHDIQTHARTLHYDKRHAKRRTEVLIYWKELLLSGAPALIKSKKLTKSKVALLEVEIDKLINNPNSIFSYTFIQTVGKN